MPTASCHWIATRCRIAILNSCASITKNWGARSERRASEFHNIVPKGQNENSPAFQRREKRAFPASPEGTVEWCAGRFAYSVVPSGWRGFTNGAGNNQTDFP